MPQTIDQSIATANDATFREQAAMVGIRHFVWVLDQDDAALGAGFPGVPAASVRQMAYALLQGMSRADLRHRWAWQLASYSNLDSSDINSITSRAQLLFAALVRKDFAAA